MTLKNSTYSTIYFFLLFFSLSAPPALANQNEPRCLSIELKTNLSLLRWAVESKMPLHEIFHMLKIPGAQPIKSLRKSALNKRIPLSEFIADFIYRRKLLLQQFSFLKLQYPKESLENLILSHAISEIKLKNQLSQQKIEQDDPQNPLLLKSLSNEDNFALHFLIREYGFIKGLIPTLFIAAQSPGLKYIEPTFTQMIGDNHMDFFTERYFNKRVLSSKPIEEIFGVDLIFIRNGIEYWVEVKNIAKINRDFRYFLKRINKQIERQSRAREIALQNYPQKKIKLVYILFKNKISNQELKKYSTENYEFIDGNSHYGELPPFLFEGS